MESSTSSSGIGNIDIIVVRRERMRIENPFTLKVGQVFTGFGIGCGLGIGVGRPLNLGAISVVNQVMGAARGATDVFSGVGRHVNDSLRKLGAKNIEAGIGCGVGFGHGFGVGLAVNPGVVNQIQSSLVVCIIVSIYGKPATVWLFKYLKLNLQICYQAVTKMMMKFGIAPNLSLGQGLIPPSLQSGMMPSNQSPIGSIMQLATKVPDQTPQGLPTDGNLISGASYETFASKQPSLDTSYGSRTEKVIGGFLQNPILKDEDSGQNNMAGRLRSENNILQMVLKNQQVIEELMKENEKLRKILVEDLKIPPSKLQGSYSCKRSSSADCLECRRKQRKK